MLIHLSWGEIVMPVSANGIQESHQLLIERCARVMPGLSVEAGEPEDSMLVAGRRNHSLLDNLVSSLQRQYPEAGRHYWGARAWGLSIWQPVLLTILVTETLQQRVNLVHLGQCVTQNSIIGMRLGARLLSAEQACRRQAAEHLRMVCDEALAELGQVIKVNRVLAQRLLGDRIVSTLLRVRPLLGNRSHTSVHRLGLEWLDAAGLAGASALGVFELPHGGTELMLDRKGCCQHYRRAGGEPCKTCPRQPRHIRVERLRAAWQMGA
ncbi:siderophore ferric iron reductase [Marinobacterium marinum]|uniref:Siderophore ferric iron reductase n=1 Tax=Marinobacterium marinum TaxID=2756129 RepID=A0A7W1WZP6_9GAMM|nr:siderophore ferric iron reductase [Marinobacterium marinum]MBA4503089.1 siderophore ferric iron reductase [Marinobacterium marinum]